MPKNLSKLILLLLSLSLTFFIVFCNYLTHSLSFCASLSAEQVELLGDRGGSHLPDLGIHITLQPWLVTLVLIICVVCIVLICILVRIKHKKTREVMKQIENSRNHFDVASEDATPKNILGTESNITTTENNITNANEEQKRNVNKQS